MSFSLVGGGEIAGILEVFEGEHGETYRLQFTNVDPAAEILDVTALVPSSDWLPRTLVFTQADGHVLAEASLTGVYSLNEAAQSQTRT